MSGGSAQSGSMAVEVARLGRKRFKNVGAVDGAEVEGSVRRRSVILSMQSVDSCSSDDRASEQCQHPSAIDRFMAFSFELFVNLT